MFCDGNFEYSHHLIGLSAPASVLLCLFGIVGKPKAAVNLRQKGPDWQATTVKKIDGETSCTLGRPTKSGPRLEKLAQLHMFNNVEGTGDQ